ncbi:MAG: hypothetical protein KAI07_08370, partial [Deltaproteobacteria bacterium]|nr:hypothetical protein [Deltaproteobacteria bacterium]
QLENPIEVFNEMRSFACAGDTDGFYSYVDKASVEKNFKKMTLQRMRVNTINEEEGGNLDPYAIREMIEVVIPNLMVLKWEIMSRELRLSEAGSLCNLEVVRETEGENAVELVFPDGKRSAWGFEKKSGALTLVSILDRKPFDIIDQDWGFERIVKDSAPKRTESSALVKNNDEELSINKSGKEDIKNSDPDDMAMLPEAPEHAIPKHAITDLPNDRDIPLEGNKGLDHEVVRLEEERSRKKIRVPDEMTQEHEKKATAQVYVGSYDVGRARWGMTKEQVISAEVKTPLLEKGDMLKYNGMYQGMGAELTYVFSANKLVKGRYKLDGSSTDEMGYIRNYLRIKELLSLKYGEPLFDQETWVNSSYKNKPDRRGFAVFIGYLSYKTKWST